jgi:hypothetical protein
VFRVAAGGQTMLALCFIILFPGSFQQGVCVAEKGARAHVEEDGGL